MGLLLLLLLVSQGSRAALSAGRIWVTSEHRYVVVVVVVGFWHPCDPMARSATQMEQKGKEKETKLAKLEARGKQQVRSNRKLYRQQHQQQQQQHQQQQQQRD